MKIHGIDIIYGHKLGSHYFNSNDVTDCQCFGFIVQSYDLKKCQWIFWSIQLCDADLFLK